MRVHPCPNALSMRVYACLRRRRLLHERPHVRRRHVRARDERRAAALRHLNHADAEAVRRVGRWRRGRRVAAADDDGHHHGRRNCDSPARVKHR
jgi:hypothetical protein